MQKNNHFLHEQNHSGKYQLIFNSDVLTVKRYLHWDEYDFTIGFIITFFKGEYNNLKFFFKKASALIKKLYLLKYLSIKRFLSISQLCFALEFEQVPPS